MKSTIRLRQDWEQQEPFIQIKLDKFNGNDDLDLADSTLIHFIQQANLRGLEVIYPKGDNDCSAPQIRLNNPKPFQDYKEVYLKQLDIFAKVHFKPNDYKNWETIYNLFVTDGVPYGDK